MQSLVDSTLLFIQQHAQWAWLVVFLIAFIESIAIVGLVLPGWALLLGVGTLIGTDVLDFYPTVLSAYFGAVLGEYFSYWLGYHYHEPILKWRWVAKHQTLIERSRVFFDRHGVAGVFIGRFIGPIRAVIPLIAGISEMRKQTFFWVNIISGLLWAPFYLIPGILIGASFELDKETNSMLLFFLVLVAILLWVSVSRTKTWFKEKQSKRQNSEEVVNRNNSSSASRSMYFSLLNMSLSWLVLLTVIIIIVSSQYYSSIVSLFSIVWSKLY
jgi:membrane protein DedA with SNARE-associated domain